MGLKIDQIEDLIEIRPEELTLPVREKYLKGLTSGTLMLLDVDAVLEKVFSAEEP
jgi:chemotaxis signal transduction protein